MDTLAKEYIISHFNKYLAFFGDRPDAVGWSQKGQLRRYEIITSIGDLSGRKVLDFGCGKGDLHQFLKDRHINLHYTGTDINENLISFAENKYPEADFRVLDIENDELNEQFDYIFICGVFNLRVQGIDETIRNVLTKLFKKCRVGIAYSGLSTAAKNRSPELYYADLEILLDFVHKHLSKHTKLIEDVSTGDFTLFIYT